MPSRVTDAFDRTALARADNPALHVKRNQQWETISWRDYRDARPARRACADLARRRAGQSRHDHRVQLPGMVRRRHGGDRRRRDPGGHLHHEHRRAVPVHRAALRRARRVRRERRAAGEIRRRPRSTARPPRHRADARRAVRLRRVVLAALSLARRRGARERSSTRAPRPSIRTTSAR